MGNNINYEDHAHKELKRWQRKMQRKPGWVNKKAKQLQNRINNIIPEKVHQAVTATIKQMVRAVLFGVEYTNPPVTRDPTLAVREMLVQEKIKFYKKTAAAEGGITGAGGILMGLADFPLLIGIKLKLLYNIAALYGYDVKDYKERLFILYIFQLAFSSQECQRDVYYKIEDWKEHCKTLPASINDFDWRNFQLEYRDYIDLAKMAQLIPFIGAPIGAIVNYRLLKKLGETAMNAYRMRWFEEKKSLHI